MIKVFNTEEEIEEESESEITFWCEKDGLKDINPIKRSVTQIPQWFKDIKVDKTIKECPGIMDYFNLGYIHYLWTDLNVTVHPEDRPTEYSVPDPDNFKIQFHHKSQYLDFIPTDKYKFVLKPISPWRCKTKEGYSTLQLPLYYEFNDIFDVMPGVINTDYYHQIHPQICFKKLGKHFLPRGTPLCMFIPFKRRKHNWNIREKDEITHKWEAEARMRIQTKFPGEYKAIKTLTKE